MKEESYLKIKIDDKKFKENLFKKKEKQIKIFLNFIIFLALFITLFKYYNLKYNYLLKEKENQSLNIYKKTPKIIAISYSNKLYQKQLALNKKSALEIGNVDEYYSYGPSDIDIEFKEKNIYILSQKRGNGYWLWKPYFILKTLKEKLKNGDYLIYTDACVLYMNSTYKIIEFMKERDAEMWADQLIYKEKNYTKRDTFLLLNADIPLFTNTFQYQATIQIYKKSKFTEKFLEELLYYSQDKRIITDLPNTLGKENYIGFKDHRHDQSVLSLLIKKYGLVNSNKTNLNITESKSITLMPSIFCLYRRLKFINYNDIRNKCIKKINK